VFVRVGWGGEEGRGDGGGGGTFAGAKAHGNFELSRRDAGRGAPFYFALRRQAGGWGGWSEGGGGARAEEALIDDGGLLITPPQDPGHVEAADKPPRSK